MSKEGRLVDLEERLVNFAVRTYSYSGMLADNKWTIKLHNSKFLVRYCPSDSPPCGRVPSFDIR